MSKQKEKFRPKVAGKVSMYVCGVTSYDYSHIGHARVYVAFDVLFRYVPSSLLWSLTHVLQPQQFAESLAVHHSFSCALFFFNQVVHFSSCIESRVQQPLLSLSLCKHCFWMHSLFRHRTTRSSFSLNQAFCLRLDIEGAVFS
jgi:hypothetical protein